MTDRYSPDVVVAIKKNDEEFHQLLEEVHASALRGPFSVLRSVCLDDPAKSLSPRVVEHIPLPAEFNRAA